MYRKESVLVYDETTNNHLYVNKVHHLFDEVGVLLKSSRHL